MAPRRRRPSAPAWPALLVLLALALLPALGAAAGRQVHERFRQRLGKRDLVALAARSSPANLTTTGSTLAPFLVPRVSGSDANKNVQRFLLDTFRGLGWHIEQDSFSDSTPFGVKEFNNIIVTKDPAAQRRLVLAAHFDSKYFSDFDFVGATDSSVPCAILVDIAKTLDALLDAKMASGDRFATVQLIFFDGEEAFVEWGPTDSIYGARHLAEKWESTKVRLLADPGAPETSASFDATPLHQIDALVLLDLLGTSDASIPNTHQETAHIWDRLVDIQRRLVRFGIVSKHLSDRVLNPKDRGFFQPGLSRYLSADSVQDDHVPFYRRGVPVVHCIPVPFPSVWHTKDDNASAISNDSVHDLALIFRTLVVEYLGLPVPRQASGTAAHGSEL
ncbi:hypothetical protein HK105_204915 [Polyrhizophydium stewartii]|uniref:Peptide hydrolase n=1 Tax=Polyrhizophydium stewartii TaxID=2732419 RepID=A0ABR4N7K8_9FUNG